MWFCEDSYCVCFFLCRRQSLMVCLPAVSPWLPKRTSHFSVGCWSPFRPGSQLWPVSFYHWYHFSSYSPDSTFFPFFCVKIKMPVLLVAQENRKLLVKTGNACATTLSQLRSSKQVRRDKTESVCYEFAIEWSQLGSYVQSVIIWRNV